MTRFFYSLLLYLLSPLLIARLLWRARHGTGYSKNLRQRFGFIQTLPSDQTVIWIHAVSLGETLAAVPLVRALLQRQPPAQILITSMTPTGAAQVRRSFGDSVHHCYAPYDLPDAVARFLTRAHPSQLVIMETELWPNWIQACHQRGIPVVLANARLSEKSAAGYRRIAGLARPMLEKLGRVAAQTAQDGQRFVALGLPTKALQITGNIKFDLAIDDQQRSEAEHFRRQWQADTGRAIWLAASTHPGEDQQILAAFKSVSAEHPGLLLVLVPRHPERFDEVAKLCETMGFNYRRRSTLQDSNPEGLGQDCEVLLGDSTGELLTWCGAADLVFVGGSLVPNGGHNLIEPAAWGVPVLSGPHLFNFEEMAQLLKRAGGLQICANAEQLASTVARLLRHPEQRRHGGQAALAVAETNRGALGKLIKLLD